MGGSLTPSPTPTHTHTHTEAEFYFQMSLLWGTCGFPGDAWWRCPFLPAFLAATRRLWLPLLPRDNHEDATARVPRGLYEQKVKPRPIRAEDGAGQPGAAGQPVSR